MELSTKYAIFEMCLNLHRKLVGRPSKTP